MQIGREAADGRLEHLVLAQVTPYWWHLFCWTRRAPSTCRGLGTFPIASSPLSVTCGLYVHVTKNGKKSMDLLER